MIKILEPKAIPIGFDDEDILLLQKTSKLLKDICIAMDTYYCNNLIREDENKRVEIPQHDLDECIYWLDEFCNNIPNRME